VSVNLDRLGLLRLGLVGEAVCSSDLVIGVGYTAA
jgi:hypothetical protein